MQTNYHTQHAPFGAFASFTIGLHNSSGGFGQSLAEPARQNHFVGFRQGGEWHLLPFFKPSKSLIENFVTTESAIPNEVQKKTHTLADGEFSRTLGWASDVWTSGNFSYGLHTPFHQVPEPEKCSDDAARFLFAPVILARLEYDNTDGTGEVEIIFGLSNPDQPWRPLRDEATDLKGFAAGNAYGFATLDEDAETRQCFSVLEPGCASEDGHHRIAQEGGLIYRVPAGQRRTAIIALGFYQAGVVTTGIPTSYWYAQYFSNLAEVLRHGLAHRSQYLKVAEDRDATLRSSTLSDDQRFILAQATHSYYGSSQLLENNGRPLWNVNEGEYRMMNTFDLTVDHLFFELEWHPWAIRNVLDLFASRYSYRDQLHNPGGKRAEGGISFTHDMGTTNQFSPEQHSSYECTGLNGCFSHMTCEQLVNWVCTALTYAASMRDTAWLREKLPILLECAESLRRRDDPDPAQRNGILKWDSDRCGHGSEITTYDSLDISLGQSRNNLYLAVKTWAAWVLLEKALATLDFTDESHSARETADLCAASIASHFEPKTGMFPAVFEGGNTSRIIPAVEGLVFPLFLNYHEALHPNGRFRELLHCLQTHLRNILKPGICLDATTGAWKLSSSSTNTWMSKIALCQHVVRRLFPAAMSPETVAADRVHAAWQTLPGCGANAMCDQIESTTGRAIGSRYYPRIVTAILWLKEPPHSPTAIGR